MEKYQHRRHNKNLLMVHLIFVTKYRKKILLGNFNNDIKQYIFDICQERHWYIKRMETDKDHIHILLQYNPTDSIKNIVSLLKQKSTYMAWKKYSNMLKKYYLLCGLTDTLRHLLGWCRRQRLNNILKIRDNKTDPKGSTLPFKFGELPTTCSR